MLEENETFVTRKNDFQPRILYLAKLSINKPQGRIKDISDMEGHSLSLTHPFSKNCWRISEKSGNKERG